MGHTTEVRTGDETRTYSYDISGRLIPAQNPHSTTSFTYDPLSNMMAETHEYDVFNHKATKHWQFEYDELSNLIATTRPNGRVVVDYLRCGSGHLHGMLLDKERLIDTWS